MREKEHCKFKGVPNKFAHCCCCCFCCGLCSCAAGVVFVVAAPC